MNGRVSDQVFPMMNIQVRRALESDRPGISTVVIAAFGIAQGKEIAELITGLLADPNAQPVLSLVATGNDRVVGHILFTNARIRHAQRTVSSAILAPLSVHPDWQNQGIGGRLVKQGLEQLREAGVELAFVLGHPGYYSRYGFSAAGIRGFEPMYPIPPENSGAWMVKELHPGVIGQVSGQVICANALDDPKHWRE